MMAAEAIRRMVESKPEIETAKLALKVLAGCS